MKTACAAQVRSNVDPHSQCVDKGVWPQKTVILVGVRMFGLILLNWPTLAKFSVCVLTLACCSAALVSASWPSLLPKLAPIAVDEGDYQA